MALLRETGFTASQNNGTSANGFIYQIRTTDPSGLFDVIRDSLVIEDESSDNIVQIIEEPVLDEQSKVTHNRFFGENIRRIVEAIKQ